MIGESCCGVENNKRKWEAAIGPDVCLMWSGSNYHFLLKMIASVEWLFGGDRRSIERFSESIFRSILLTTLSRSTR